MKKYIILLIGVPAIVLCSMFLIINDTTSASPDMVSINDAVITALQSEDPSIVMNSLVDTVEQEYARMDAINRNRDVRLFILLCILLIAVISIGLAGYVYVNKTILKPFNNLQNFAKNITTGNLDVPLEMDRNYNFGAFSESFDLMRDELKRARENERAADRSKKELVASLSHDIKTPVASIKATVELMQVGAKSEKEQEQLRQIGAKAEQINTLITDMFHATLHELEELSVNISEIESTLLHEIITSSDYKERINHLEIPHCIVISDPIRLQQIFDNVIGNSYKYADTVIEVSSKIEGNYLAVEVTDFGAGVPAQDQPLVMSKFYRGQNASDKSGYGLGLYISSYLISKMSGEMDCFNAESGGFTVNIRLRLAGTK